MTEPKNTIESATGLAHAVNKMPQGSLSLILMFALCVIWIWIQTDTMREMSSAAEKNAEASERMAAAMESIATKGAEADAKFLELTRQQVDLAEERLKALLEGQVKPSP